MAPLAVKSEPKTRHKIVENNISKREVLEKPKELDTSFNLGNNIAEHFNTEIIEKPETNKTIDQKPEKYENTTEKPKLGKIEKIFKKESKKVEDDKISRQNMKEPEKEDFGFEDFDKNENFNILESTSVN